MGKGIFKVLFVVFLVVSGGVSRAETCERKIQQFEILEDNGLTIQQAITANGYHSANQIQLGYTQKTYWVRFALPELCETKSLINLDFWGLDYIDMYLVQNDKVVDSLFTGYLRPLNTREKPIPQFVKTVPPGFKAGDMVYVKLWKLEGTLMADVWLQDETALRNQTAEREMTMLFFSGICFIMIVLALSYYFYFRLNMFVWYAILLLVFAFKKVVNFGYGSLYVWGDFDWLTIYSRSIWMAPSLLFFLLFAHQLLKVKEFSPPWIDKVHKVLVWLMIIEFPLSLLPLPPYPWRIALYLILVLAIVATAVIYFYASVYAMRRKHLSGYLFFVCELLLLFTTILMIMRNFGVLPAAWVPHELHIHMFILMMPVMLFSLIAYTRNMHVVKVKEEVLVPYKPEPKPLNEDEAKKAEEAYGLIEKFFNESKPYLDAGLTVDTLSESINLHSHLISRAINTYANKHFFDYVNSYRIEEAKVLLLDKEAQKVYTIEGIAGMCGFSNKTTFNKAFKKFTGQTPSAFRQKEG